MEILKVFIKDYWLKILRKHGDLCRCCWITDAQSQSLSIKAYIISKTENWLRSFINVVMTSNYGIEWVKQVKDVKLCKKYSLRSELRDSIKEIIDDAASVLKGALQ